jgi:hypothetical protein
MLLLEEIVSVPGPQGGYLRAVIKVLGCYSHSGHQPALARGADELRLAGRCQCGARQADFLRKDWLGEGSGT